MLVTIYACDSDSSRGVSGAVLHRRRGRSNVNLSLERGGSGIERAALTGFSRLSPMLASQRSEVLDMTPEEIEAALRALMPTPIDFEFIGVGPSDHAYHLPPVDPLVDGIEPEAVADPLSGLTGTEVATNGGGIPEDPEFAFVIQRTFGTPVPLHRRPRLLPER